MYHTLVLLFDEGRHVTWSYTLQELHVFIRMKLGHFTLGGRFGSLFVIECIRSA